jgi:hypothetical protein
MQFAYQSKKKRFYGRISKAAAQLLLTSSVIAQTLRA